MNSIIKSLGILVVVVLGFTSINAYAQYPVRVNVNVQQPVPPYLPQIKADITGNRTGQLNQDISKHLSVTLTNSGNTQKHVKLSGTIERLSPAPLSISLKPSYQPSNPVLVNPQQMIRLNQPMLDDAFGHFSKGDLVFNNTSLSTLQQEFNYKLPEGTYRICINAYDFDKPGQSAPLSAPGTGCATFIICYSASAPQMIMPVSTMMQSNSGFEDFTPRSPQIQFTWTPPTSTCGKPIGALTYDLEIREVFPGQTIKDGLRTPPVFHKRNIPTTTFLLDTLRFPHVFQPGKRYTIRVKANFRSKLGSPLEVANEGYSQIAGLKYVPETIEPESRVATNNDNSNYDPLPKKESHVKGKLMYRFPGMNDAELYPAGHVKIYLKKVFAKRAYDQDSVMSYKPLTQAEENSLPDYQSMLDGVMVETDEEGNFTLDVEMTALDSGGVIAEDNWNDFLNLQYKNNDQYLEEGHSDNSQAMSSLKGKLACFYKIATPNNHYLTDDQQIRIEPGATKNLNTVILDANAYTLKVNVKEMIEEQVGDYVAGAEVSIYRLTKNKEDEDLGIPMYEGDLLQTSDWQEEGDKVLIATGVTPGPDKKSNKAADYTVSFPRIFRNPGSESYDYLIRLKNGKKTYRSNTSGRYIAPILPSRKNNGVLQSFTSNTTQAKNLKNVSSFNSEENRDPFGQRRSSTSGQNVALKQGQGLATNNFNGPNQGYIGAPTIIQKDRNPKKDAEIVNSNSEQESSDQWMNWEYNKDPNEKILTLMKELVEPPHSKVTGTLKYKYKNDPSIPAQAYANMPVKLVVVSLFKPGDDTTNGNNTNAASADDSGFVLYSGVAEPYYDDYWVQGIANEDSDAYKPTSAYTESNNNKGKVLQTVMTDNEGRFTFDFENVDSTLTTEQGSIPNTNTNLDPIQGHFKRVLRVVPDVEQYAAPEKNVTVQPWDDFDCGTLTSYVRTFKLKVNVLADEELFQQNNIPVQVYYNQESQSAYPFPTKPGVGLNKEATVNGNTYTLKRKGELTRNSEVAYEYGEVADEILNGGSRTFGRDTLTVKTLTFADLVIGSMQETYMIEAGGDPTKRKGNLSIEPDRLMFPKEYAEEWGATLSQISRKWAENMKGTIVHVDDEYNAPEGIVYNSEVDPSLVINVYLATPKSKPRIAGRAIDEFTSLGIPRVRVQLNRYKDGNSRRNMQQVVYTDENGYYDFSEYLDDFREGDEEKYVVKSITFFADGYDILVRDVSNPVKGEQIYDDPVVLKAKGVGAYGYVFAANDTTQPLTARVKYKVNGRWVNTYKEEQGSIRAGNYFGNEGILEDIVNTAAYNQVNGIPDHNPGWRNAGSLPTAGTTMPGAGLSPAQGGGMRGRRNPLQGSMHGPAYGVSPMITMQDPPGEKFRLGGLIVETDNKGAIQELSLDEDAGNAGQWESYVKDFNSRQTGTNMQAKNTLGTADVIKQGTYRQRFDIDLPTGLDSIMIVPYDKSYIPQTFAVQVDSSHQPLGKFFMEPRIHKVLIKVNMHDLAEGTETEIKRADISIDGVDKDVQWQQVSKGAGFYTEFVNNSTANYTLRVKPKKDQDQSQQSQSSPAPVFVPITTDFTSNDEGTTVVEVNVIAGKKLVGDVQLESGEPVAGAVVFLEQGKGMNTDVKTYTDENGEFVLPGVPPFNFKGKYTVKAAYSDENSTYVADVKKVAVNAPEDEPIHFVIQELEDVDITHLLGLPVALTEVKTLNNGHWSISGSFHDLPKNENFELNDETLKSSLTFDKIEVKASELLNEEGVPLATPVDDHVLLDNRSFYLKAFEVYNAKASAADNNRMELMKESDTTGGLKANVRIIDNSFNFPTSYMSISNSDFYLGNYGEQMGEDKLSVPIFKSSPYPLTRFSLTNGDGDGFAFKYLGFDGITGAEGERESYIEGDEVNLFMNLETTLEGDLPLSINAGKAVLTHEGMQAVSSEDTIRMKLEEWDITAKGWELSPTSGGISLSEGYIHTGKADLPFGGLAIIPGDPYSELSCNSLSASELIRAANRGDLTLGGGATRLNLYNGVDVIFAYDPDAGSELGKGHYKFSLTSSSGKVAYFGGLDKMTDANQRFNIQYMFSLSNGEDLFAFDANTNPVIFYNQLQFTPQRLFGSDDNFIIGGAISFGVDQIPDNIKGNLKFDYVNEGSTTNKLSLASLNFHFTGAGGTKFTTVEGDRQMERLGIGIPGKVSLPGTNTTLETNFVSMVAEGAKSFIPANGKVTGGASSSPSTIKLQTEVLLGNIMEGYANEFESNSHDKVSRSGNTIRQQIINDLNGNRSTTGQSFDFGDQSISNLRGKWRLAGSGMNVIKNRKDIMVGPYLRLNGDMDGFTGMKDTDDDYLEMYVDQEIKANKGRVEVANITGAGSGGSSGAGTEDTFSNMNLDIDLNTGRITGAMYMDHPLNFGAVTLNDLGIEILIDSQGWYFYAGGGFDLPTTPVIHPIVVPLSVGLLIGDYPTISPSLESRVTQLSYVKRMPSTIKSNGIGGFFLIGRKDILKPSSIGVDIGIVELEIGASVGLDARLYANFGDEETEVGFGALAFGEAYAKLEAAGVCGVSGSVAVQLGAKAAVRNNSNGTQFNLDACGSLTLTGSAWCDGLGDTDFSKSLRAELGLCAGDCDGSAVDFDLGFGSCSESSSFDY